MNRDKAIEVFGGAAALARELGVKRQAVYLWPEELPQRTADRLIGLALRKGKLHELYAHCEIKQ